MIDLEPYEGRYDSGVHALVVDAISVDTRLFTKKIWPALNRAYADMMTGRGEETASLEKMVTWTYQELNNTYLSRR